MERTLLTPVCLSCVGLEMLANLSLVSDNYSPLSESLEHWVYVDIVNMLLVHDIQLIVHTLETLYQLSELGELPASRIAEVRAAIGESHFEDFNRV